MVNRDNLVVIMLKKRSLRSKRPKNMEFLWVRWLGVVPNRSFGRKQARLPQIGFVKESDEYAFGFLDPSLVLRGCHLIPSFVDGRTNDLLATQGATEARPQGQTNDWANYYVGIFVDRDMLSRFLGTGIGHKEQTNQHDGNDSEQDEMNWSDNRSLDGPAQDDDADDNPGVELSQDDGQHGEVELEGDSDEEGVEDDDDDDEDEDDEGSDGDEDEDEADDEDDTGYEEF